MLIEINLAPGASTARFGGRRLPGLPALRLPALPALGAEPRVVLGGAVLALTASLLVFGYWRMGEHRSALHTQVQQEVTDSARFAATIELVRSLQARQDTIVQKIGVIREVDTRRYVWPHLLDEISAAVPAYIWLTQIQSSGAANANGGGPVFTLQGNAGSTQAMTRFMKGLEDSPFIRDVTLVTTEQDVVDGRTIQAFTLEARYRVPESWVIQTVPIVGLE